MNKQPNKFGSGEIIWATYLSTLFSFRILSIKWISESSNNSISDNCQHLTQFEFGNVLLHNSLLIKYQNVWMPMISPLKRFLAAVAADVWPHYKGYSGFKSGAGKVIFKRLGPLMGRVSLQAGGAQKLQYSGLPSHIFNCIFTMI